MKMNNETIIKFVRLTPLERFFFGGEQGTIADYYLKGNFMPQQTALLGLMRHQVLIQNDLLDDSGNIKDKEKSIKWIGKNSFEYDKDNTFGYISRISQCYLVNGDKKYLPFYHSYINNIRKAGDNFFFPDHDPKEYYQTIWKETNGEVEVKEGDCFKSIERIGVDKNYEGQTQNESFYKQVWLQMNKDWSFGFYVELDKNIELNDSEVFFGKESSPFQMKTHELSENEPEAEISDVDDANAILLLSDAYVEEDLSKYCNISVNEILPFRNIVTRTASKDEKYSYYSNHKSKVRLQLYKRGSVFASKKSLDKITDLIDEHKNFQGIGYNQYCKIKLNF